MIIRELHEADLPALLWLCERALVWDRFTLPLLRRRVLEEPNRNQAYQLSAWEGERLVGVLLAGTRAGDTGPSAAIRLMAVEPDQRRRGIASALLAELEARLRTAGFTQLKVGGSAPSYFWAGVDVRYTPAVCLFERHGFVFRNGAVNMLVDLHARTWDTAAEEARLAQRGFAVRRLTHEDRPAFGDWLQRIWSSTWHDEALDTYALDPVATFVATEQGQICAFACYGVGGGESGFGPTGTEEWLRGLGLGRVLFYRCMSDMRALGHDSSEVQWVGPIPFYARIADAWINRTFWVMEKGL